MKLTENELRNLLDTTPKPVVVDFFATWCGPCVKFSPIFEAVAKKNGEQFDFAKVDIDHCAQLCEDVNISVVPTLMVFKNSKIVNRKEGGFPDEAALEKWIKSTQL